jgi:5,10-methylenetetrahydrofolate reductase
MLVSGTFINIDAFDRAVARKAGQAGAIGRAFSDFDALGIRSAVALRGDQWQDQQKSK